MKRLLPSLLFLACGGEVISLPRSDYKHYEAVCSKGINQQTELADPKTECSDAQNVWAPDGTVVQRPGYAGIGRGQFGIGTATVFFARAEDTSAAFFTSPSGAGVLTLGTSESGGGPLRGRVASGGNMDRWYIGLASTFNGFTLRIVAANTNTTQAKAEYWNGTAWTHIKFLEIGVSAADASSGSDNHLDLPSGSRMFFSFAAPQDWATTTVDSQSAYWVRFNLLDVDLAAATQIDVDDALTVTVGAFDVRGMFVANFPSNKRYISVTDGLTGSTTPATVYQNGSEIGNRTYVSRTLSPGVEGENASIAVISEFDTAFVAYAYRVTTHNAFPVTASENVATVEDRDALIGPGAAFDRNLIVQDSTFPQAKYVTFFKGRLWALNLLGQPTTVQWSGASPGYRVWPSLSKEPLVEDDNSPITGGIGFNEHLVVFKNDSTWIMVDEGVNEFDLTEFTPVRVVPGVGCVANNSIQQIRGNLIFLGEDGIYRFDGTPSIFKLSDRVNETIRRITPGRRPFAASAHWKTHHVYLLAVSVNGSEANNRVLVWDYKNDAWWIWTNIEAQHFLVDEGSYDEERLYFGDSTGRIYELGVGRTDHGGTITSYIETQRLGYNERNKKRLREVRVHGDSQFTSATFGAYVNDSPSTTATATADFSDPVETTASRPRVRRPRRVDFYNDFDWLTVRVTNSTKNTELVSSLISVGYNVVSRR